MHAIFGLGNPGKRYAQTRHNIGFMALDFIANEQKIPFHPGKGDYYFGLSSIEDQPAVLIKPTTFMNNSGTAVRQVCEMFEIPAENILVVYDDFHLPFGMLRFRKKGRDGGHNGLRSIIYETLNDVFPRLKIGISNDFENSVDYVLSDFKNNELQKLPELLTVVHQGIRTWLTDGIDVAMNNYNRNVLNTTGN